MDVATSSAPPGTPPDRPSGTPPEDCSHILGETDLERTERHIRTLRRLTELALAEAERLGAVSQAAAEAQTAQPETAQPDSAPPKPDGEVSLALHRLTRIVRLNIALEDRLVEVLRYPGPRSLPKPPQAKTEKAPAETAAALSEKKAQCEALAEDWALSDRWMPREIFNELMAELSQGLADGIYDEDLDRHPPQWIAWRFLKQRDVMPDVFGFDIPAEYYMAYPEVQARGGRPVAAWRIEAAERALKAKAEAGSAGPEPPPDPAACGPPAEDGC